MSRRCLAAAIVLLSGCAEDGEVGWMGIGRVDEHDDGSQDETWHRRVAPNGQVMWEEWFSPLVRSLPGGRTEYTYDADGLVIEETYDLYGDGVLDRWYLWTRDEEGRPLTFQRLDPDGALLAETIYTYDGELLVETRAESSGADWEDGVATYTYDPEGRLVRLEYDYRLDGTVDRREEHTYLRSASLDGDYRLDVDGDGLWDLDRTGQFDAGGRMVHSEGQEYGVEVIRDSEFDREGRLLFSQATTERAESTATWRYGREGFLRETVDSFRPFVEDAGEDDVTRELWAWTPADELD